MKKRNNNVNSEIGLNIGKNSKPSLKQATSLLPQLRDTNPPANSKRHFLLVKNNKRLASRQKEPSVNLHSSANPQNSDSINFFYNFLSKIYAFF